MDPYTAYQKVIRALTDFGHAPQIAPAHDFFPALQLVAQQIGEKSPKQSGDVCQLEIHLPFLLAIRLEQSLSREAFLFGYEVLCPPLGKRFFVYQGTVYVQPITDRGEIEIPVTTD